MLKRKLVGVLLAGLLVTASAVAEEGYRSQVQAGILENENAILKTLQAFQSPLNGTESFCLSFVTRVSDIDLDSLYLILRDKDAEKYLPDIEIPRQAEVKAELGSDSYGFIVKKLEKSLETQANLKCDSANEQTALKTKVIAIFADLVSSHSAIEVNTALLFQNVDYAERTGLLSQDEVALLKTLAAK